MATAGDDAEPTEPGRPPARQLSLLSFLLIVIVLTVIAGAAGFFGGLQILASVEQTLLSKKDETPDLLGKLEHMKPANVKVLAPITTNLSGSPPVWIRLESSLVFRDEVPKDADALAAQIAEDIVAFLRTVSAQQIEGASGFQHLSEDLNDRVRVRSVGRVQELIIQGLIVE
jgi:flagellar FliL protein